MASAVPRSVVDEIRSRKVTPTTEHLNVVLSVTDGAAFPKKGRIASDIMTEASESNSLELRIAFHNAVSRFQDWTTGVAEPRVKLHGRFCAISQVCQEVATLSNALPEAVLSILYKEANKDDDITLLKMDRTYRGGGRHLYRLIENRKRQRRRESRP
jgi:hypothetical protein